MTRLPLWKVISASCILSLSPARALDAVLTDDISVSSAPRKVALNGARPRLALSDTATVYLRFDLASALPSGVTSTRVEKATLWVWVSSLSKTGTGNIGVHPVVGLWSERMFLSAAPPVLGPMVATKVADRASQFVVFDVTATVKGWLDGSLNQGVALKGWAPTGFLHILPGPDDPIIARTPFRGAIDSKENVASARLPRLQISLLPPSPEATQP